MAHNATAADGAPVVPSAAMLLHASSAASIAIARQARERRERERAARDARVTTVRAADPRQGRTPVPPAVRETLRHDSWQRRAMPTRVNAPDARWSLLVAGAPDLAPTASHERPVIVAPEHRTGVPLPSDPIPAARETHAPAPIMGTPEDAAAIKAWRADRWQAPVRRDPWCQTCAKRHPGGDAWHPIVRR